MKDIILFRFHKNAKLCSQRIKYLQKLNPNMDIYGVGEKIDNIELLYESGLKHCYFLTEKNKRWCWLNGDKVMVEWYKEIGKNINFNRLYLIEWDLLLTKSIEEIYPQDGDVGLTGKITFEQAKKQKLITGDRKKEYEYLKQNILNMETESYYCILPGFFCSKYFLNEISRINLPTITNDECRIGLLAGYLNIEVTDTGFFKWHNKNNIFFNSMNIEPKEEEIKEQLKNNQYIFHPYRKKIKDINKIYTI